MLTLQWKTVESNEKPVDIDEASSPTVTYVHRNAHEVTKKDEEGNDYTVWQFERATLTKDRYATYYVEQEADANNTEVQLAIAELAESMME